ncbi:hypothetical protein ACJIZ3_000299 [Penstemon smallii]|uniref:Large ribosomal subunit protein uL23cz/uL23cy n=1 Tax=Penstemon smallii TaxID=265156 RepID=A0ABD3R577_9LAMI
MVTHYFDESFLWTEEDYVNTYSKSHLSDSINRFNTFLIPLLFEETLHFNCIRLLGKNQYTSNVESGSTRTELKHWVELFFGVKVIAMNSHRLPGKGRRMGPIMGHTMQYRRMIITLQPGYSIPPLRKKRT